MFSDVLKDLNWNEISDKIKQKTDADVRKALSKRYCDIDDFMALISEAASPYLENMALLSFLSRGEALRTMSRINMLNRTVDPAEAKCFFYCIVVGKRLITRFLHRKNKPNLTFRFKVIGKPLAPCFSFTCVKCFHFFIPANWNLLIQSVFLLLLNYHPSRRSGSLVVPSYVS